MYKNQTVSLVLPAYNEDENINRAVEEYALLGIFDEIIVVDNNSSDKTSLYAKKSGARVVTEKKQGYGFALRKGMSVAIGDLIVLSEPDRTFLAKDTLRLLKFTSKYDLVTGTRTNPNFISSQANMKTGLRLGNFLLAKLIQFLYRTNDLSDCGCTNRVLKKELVEKIQPDFKVGGSHFLPEITILTALNGGQIKEIPIHYKKRIGTSKITGSLPRSILVGCRMLALVLGYRWRWLNFFSKL